jgi:hypothetical protein
MYRFIDLGVDAVGLVARVDIAGELISTGNVLWCMIGKLALSVCPVLVRIYALAHIANHHLSNEII